MSTRQSARGQSLVEIALVLPVFLLLVLGLLDVGRLVFAYNTLSQAAREGARLASVQAGWIPPLPPGVTCTIPMPDLSPPPATACPTNSADFATRVERAVNRMTLVVGTLPSSQITISCATVGDNCATGHQTGSPVTVKVTYSFRMITPFIGQIIDNIPLAAAASMTIN